jgi:uncharacterized protein (TIGR02588 family)
MAPRKPAPSRIARRTPILEWAAAALGLLLTLAILGYSIWEGVSDHEGPPHLTVAGEPAEATEGGFVVPLTVRNRSYATAAGVEVRATLERDGRVVEERRVVFTYVPGRGEAKGGVVFQADPATAQLRLEPEGYQDP